MHEDAWKRADTEARLTVWLWAMVLIVAMGMAIHGCESEPMGALAASTPVPWDQPNTAHDCHLKAQTDWTEQAIILKRGFDGTDRILLVQLDGCQCILYVPEWAPDAMSFPLNQPIWLRGITVGAPGQDRELLMALGVDERL